MEKKDLKTDSLPDAPGVYFFARGDEVLYVGKATSLKSRVRSYFDPDLSVKRSPIVEKAVRDATEVRTVVTDSVLEALLLEARYIKDLKPYGNTQEKDDKSFNYVVVTNEAFPRLLTLRGRELSARIPPKERKYVFGPFTQGGALKEALKIIRKIFPYFDERSREIKTLRFNQSIGVYPDISAEEYARTIQHIRLLFEGKKKALLTSLEREMQRAAKNEEFETANMLKRQLFSLTHLQDIALIKDEYRTPHSVGYRIEAYDTAHLGGSSPCGVMVVVADGEPVKAEYRTFTIQNGKKGDDLAALTEVLTRRFAHPEWETPKLIVIDGGRTHLAHATKVLRSLKYDGDHCAVVKDDKHKAREILGKKSVTGVHTSSILLANAEAHRFSIGRHRRALRTARVP
jgi:excinuclease ABC subunit C